MKSILITGCNRGLGLGMLRCLKASANPPQHIFATCRNIEKAAELRELVDSSTNMHIIEMDITDTSSHAKAVEYVRNVVQTDGLNVLYNNAGTGGKSVRLAATKEQVILSSFKLNACAHVLMTQSFLPLLKAAAAANPNEPVGLRRSAVINISSILGSMELNNEGGLFAYRMSKAALNAATKAMSVEFKRDHMLCVAIHPGWIKTDMGGPKAPLEVQPTLTELLATLERLDASANGTFIDYTGKRLPW